MFLKEPGVSEREPPLVPRTRKTASVCPNAVSLKKRFSYLKEKLLLRIRVL